MRPVLAVALVAGSASAVAASKLPLKKSSLGSANEAPLGLSNPPSWPASVLLFEDSDTDIQGESSPIAACDHVSEPSVDRLLALTLAPALAWPIPPFSSRPPSARGPARTTFTTPAPTSLPTCHRRSNHDPHLNFPNFPAAKIDAVYATNGGYDPVNNGQFVDSRYALMFKPGTYTVDVPVGYYTQVLGLGDSPDDVVFSGSKGVYCETGSPDFGT